MQEIWRKKGRINMEYKIVSGKITHELENEVNKLMSAGWKPYGSPYGLTLEISRDTRHYQAMTRSTTTNRTLKR
jgi:hypothetical protein